MFLFVIAFNFYISPCSRKSEAPHFFEFLLLQNFFWWILTKVQMRPKTTVKIPLKSKLSLIHDIIKISFLQTFILILLNDCEISLSQIFTTPKFCFHPQNFRTFSFRKVSEVFWIFGTTYRNFNEILWEQRAKFDKIRLHYLILLKQPQTKIIQLILLFSSNFQCIICLEGVEIR
jgi:hypothetical protein